MRRRFSLCAAAMALCLLLSACGSPVPAAVPDGVCGSPARMSQCADMPDEDYFAAFAPVVRFAVASDVHIADMGSVQEEQRLAQLFAAAYGYADAFDGYTGLDGVFFAGDISDRGTVGSLQKFFSLAAEGVREGTTLRATMGNHEYYDDKNAAVERFLDASGYDAEDAHLTVGGYHCIFLSPDNGGKGYSRQKQKFLSEALAEAAADDPTGCKPIFVFQHHHVTGTVYGSVDSWGVSDLTDILARYPQVVDFSGHSHFPINDPRSVWQGEFTALGTGTLSYYEMDLAGVKPSYIFPTDRQGSFAFEATGKRDAAQFYIVELDENHAMRILGYDLLSGGWMMEPLTFRCVDERACFAYTEERAAASEAPVFAPEAAVTEVSRVGRILTLAIPQAAGEDMVQHYRCQLYLDDREVQRDYRLADTCFLPVPESVSLTYTDLTPGGRYRLEITAVNSWGAESEPLCYTWTA